VKLLYCVAIVKTVRRLSRAMCHAAITLITLAGLLATQPNTAGCISDRRQGGGGGWVAEVSMFSMTSASQSPASIYTRRQTGNISARHDSHSCPSPRPALPTHPSARAPASWLHRAHANELQQRPHTCTH